MRLGKMIQLLRVKEWLFSKVPFMFMPILMVNIYDSTLVVERQLALCISFFIYIFVFLGFGYAINDYSDKVGDKKIGKKNVMAELKEYQCYLILILLVVIGFQFGFFFFSIKTIVLLIFTYFWGAAYSIKPFRFKERGTAGLLVSSLAQRTIPLLPLIGVSTDYTIPVIVCGILGFLVGLRYILIHQYEDKKNDEINGINTYVRSSNLKISHMIIVILIIEICCIGYLIYEYFSLPIILGVALSVIQTFLQFYTVRVVYKKEYVCSFICVPFEELYNFYLPLAAYLILGNNNRIWYLMLIVHVLLTYSIMLEKIKIAFFGITHWRK